MFRRFTIAVSLAITFAGCAGDHQTPARGPDGGDDFTKDETACAIYPLYSVGDCSSLVKRSTFTGQVKTDYTYPSSSDKRYRAPTYLIDLQKINLSTQVTRNFRLSEFLSNAKGRYGYFAEHVFGLLQGIRDDLGVPLRINSGYRSPAYNKKIGGARLSRHMYGDGVDLGGSSTTKMKNACRAAGASYIQVYSDGHVHCDWRSRALDDTFVPNAAPAELTPLQISAMSHEEFVHLQEVTGGKPVIAIDGDAQAGSTVTFTAAVELQEDPGELLTEWIVVRPNGESQQMESGELALELNQRGQYQIHVRVGGYAESSYTLDVP